MNDLSYFDASPTGFSLWSSAPFIRGTHLEVIRGIRSLDERFCHGVRKITDRLGTAGVRTEPKFPVVYRTVLSTGAFLGTIQVVPPLDVAKWDRLQVAELLRVLKDLRVADTQPPQ